MRRGTSRVPLFLTALGVLVLVGVVAVASSGSTPTGSNDSRPPADFVIDTMFSLALLLLVPAAAMLIYGLMQRKAIAREMAFQRYPRVGIVTFLAFMLVVGAFGVWGVRRYRPGEGGDEFADALFPGIDRPLRPEERGEVTGSYEAEFAWIPVLVVVGLVAIGIAAFIIADRRRRAPLALDDALVAEEVANALEDSLDDLRAEPDPRRAVIATYARLELALGASGLPRRQEETADEYVTRILDRLEVDRKVVRRLMELFTYAKFSDHDVDQSMKDEAIEALAQIRDELRAAASRRAEARSAALAREREQAATA
jgi:hypothetical protein